MCDRLGQLQQAMSRYAAGFDAATLSLVDAREALGYARGIANAAATVEALAADRVAQGAGWRAGGQRSAAHELARSTKTSVRDAQDTLSRGRRLAEQPEVADAARRGELSPAQASAIADAAAADPGSAPELLARAADSSLAELRQHCAQAKAAADTDLEGRREQIQVRRRLRAWTDSDGEWHLNAHGNPEDGAQVMAALAPIRDVLFRSARQQGRREPTDAYAFDALIELCTNTNSDQPSDADPDPAPGVEAPADPGPVADAGAAPDTHPGVTPGVEAVAGRATETDPGPGRATRRRPRKRRGAPVKLLLRMDYDTWLRGFPVNGETIELVGYGPIAMSAARQLLDQGDPFIAAIVTKSKAVAGVAHLGRQPTAHQRSALEWLYPSCAALGCACQAHLEIDHRRDWAETHYTMIDLLDALCTHHHRLKTRDGWALIQGTGKRHFVPPTDPRHPRHHTTAAA